MLYITSVIIERKNCFMPAKRLITKESIIQASIEMVREGGFDTINARNLAKKLNCSTQPIYFSFANMEELKQETILYANQIHKQYIENKMKASTESPYKVYGMSYIQFAKEERELFKLLFMRDRSIEQQIKEKAELAEVIKMVEQLTGLDYEEAYLFQMEMWFSVHGIASMIAFSYIDLEDEKISRVVKDSFDALMKQHVTKQ